jgi:hypothetical protein
MDWEPILTAPKDGTDILGYDGEAGYKEMSVVYWDIYDKAWCLRVTGAYAEDDHWYPTHWHPLPKFPKEA